MGHFVNEPDSCRDSAERCLFLSFVHENSIFSVKKYIFSDALCIGLGRGKKDHEGQPLPSSNFAQAWKFTCHFLLGQAGFAVPNIVMLLLLCFAVCFLLFVLFCLHYCHFHSSFEALSAGA